MEKTIQEIAKKLGFETLEMRHQDSLDFREVAVWSLKEALIAAYRAGQAIGPQSKTIAEKLRAAADAAVLTTDNELPGLLLDAAELIEELSPTPRH